MGYLHWSSCGMKLLWGSLDASLWGNMYGGKYSDCGLMSVNSKWKGEYRGVSNSKSFPLLLLWLAYNQTTNRCYLNVALRQTQHWEGAPLTLWECDPLVTSPRLFNHLSLTDRQLHLLRNWENDIKRKRLVVLHVWAHLSGIPHINVIHFPKYISGLSLWVCFSFLQVNHWFPFFSIWY